MPVDRPWDLQKEYHHLPLPSREEFLEGRQRRFGRTNPELMRVPFWEHMVATQRTPYFLREGFGDEEIWYSPEYDQKRSAIWSFQRIGMTTTWHKERFLISIGGFHEDGSSPDFLIYNDVVVRDLLGNVWIYGYPPDVFPPTDFHTATFLNGDWDSPLPTEVDHLTGGIIIIGCLGYPADREFGRTPVYRLDLNEM